MKQVLKKAAACALSVMLLGGGLQALPAGVSLPAITAKAAGGSVTLSEDGVLTLHGEVTKEQIWEYKENDNVKSVFAAPGTVRRRIVPICSVSMGRKSTGKEQRLLTLAVQMHPALRI